MNHFYLVVCFINVFVFSVKSSPTATITNIFDLIQSYSVNNCPALNKNVLIDKNMAYLSRCRDVSLEKVPARVAFDSMNAYLCVGILEADLRLCNALSKESYTNLPKSYEDLRESIETIGKNPADKVCNGLKNVTSPFNYSSEIGEKLYPWMSKLNEQLFGAGCSFLCADLGNKTNAFCSLLYYIDLHIQNVIEQRIPKTIPAISSSSHVPVKSTIVENFKHDNAVAASVLLDKSKHKFAPQAPAARIQPIVEQQTKVKATTITTTESTSSTKQHDPANGDMKKEIQSQAETKVVLGTAGQNAEAKLPAPVAAPVQPAIDKKLPSVKPKETIDNPIEAIENPKEPIEKPKEAIEKSKEPIEKPKEPIEKSKEPIEKPKESEQLEKEKIDEHLHSVIAQNSAPETENTAGENKLETAETKEESEGANKNAAIETTEKLDNEIFATPGPVGLKEPNYLDEDDDANFKVDDAPGPDKDQESVVPVVSNQSISPREYADVEDSNFFAYFMFISVMFIAGYVVYHNKQKILALVLEGRRDRNSRRRPNTASYRKLNSNLEEAVTSKCSGSAAHVIY